MKGHEVQACCPSCFKRTHLESVDIHVLDPSHRSVMDEVAAIVKVVNGGLYVHISPVDFECCFLEENCFALHVGCVQTESDATAFKNKCYEIAKRA